MELNTLLDILKVAVGLVYLYLEYNAKRGLWIASVIMPAIGMWLFYNKGLYADCAINVYYLAIAVYGWIVWSRSPKATGVPARNAKDDMSETGQPATQCIRHTPWRVVGELVATWICIWAAIAWLLGTYTDSTVVTLDSLTTSMSIIGMWMLARKYIEQWLVWLVVDAIYVYLYYYKGIYFSGSLYLFYTVMAVIGYRKWCRLANAHS